MILPILAVAVGLVHTLIGMVITFRADPPNPIPQPLQEHAKWQMKFLLALKRGNILQPFLTKNEWSRVGFSLLKIGTFLQFCGTVWQIIGLASREKREREFAHHARRSS